MQRGGEALWRGSEGVRNRAAWRGVVSEIQDEGYGKTKDSGVCPCLYVWHLRVRSFWPSLVCRGHSGCIIVIEVGAVAIINESALGLRVTCRTLTSHLSSRIAPRMSKRSRRK